MSPNELPPGSQRLGLLFDGHPDTPAPSALLKNDGRGITLLLPTGGFGEALAHDHWFSDGILRPDSHTASGAVRAPKSPPELIQFRDTHGVVTLVGCRNLRSVMSIRSGEGELRARFAILGPAGFGDARVCGVRLNFTGLREWGKVSSVQLKSLTTVENKRIAELHIEAPPPVRLARECNLGLRADWQLHRGGQDGRVTISDDAEIVTETARPRPIQDHLDLANAVRSLASLAAWRDLQPSNLSIKAAANVLPEGHPRWLKAELPANMASTKNPGSIRFDYQLSDIGPRGVKRWLRLRSEMPRPINHLMDCIEQPNTDTDTQFLRTGLALEGLGHALMKRQGRTPGKGKASFAYWDYLTAITEDLGNTPLSNTPQWKKLANDCYRGMKHADNPMPDAGEVIKIGELNASVLRLWFAKELGAPSSRIQEHILKVERELF